MNENNKEQSVSDIVLDSSLGEQLKQLVLERISVMPDTLSIAVGSETLTRGAMSQHVEEGDETGRQIIEMELSFLRDLGSGRVYGNA
jgi:hypothetical protein